MDVLMAWDRRIQQLIESGAGGVFDFPMHVLSTLSYFVPVLLAVMIWLIWRGGARGRALAVVAVVLVIVTDQGSSQILKPFFDRPRPHNPDPGFPSSHASNLFAQAMLFARSYPRLAPLFFSIAAVTGISRVYLGKHYPLDVIAGALFGVLCGLAADMTVRRSEETIERGWRRIFRVLPRAWQPR